VSVNITWQSCLKECSGDQKFECQCKGELEHSTLLSKMQIYRFVINIEFTNKLRGILHHLSDLVADYV